MRPSVGREGYEQGRACTLGPYSLRVTTSGAIQYGVPTIVLRFDSASFSCAQNPKSAANHEQGRESASSAPSSPAYACVPLSLYVRVWNGTH
jgi:hypothetical protein